MNLGENLQSALHNVKANKMRSFLTMLGIIIGISSVITIVAIGNGGKEFITGEFADLGTNTINLQMKSRDKIEDRDYFTLEDIALLKKNVPEITHAAAWVEGYGRVKTEEKSKQAQMAGVNLDYYKIARVEMVEGRFLSERDLETGKAVGVIDDITAKKLFPNMDPIGKKIKLNTTNNNFNVSIIGVFKDPNGKLASTFGGGMPGTVLFPITIAEEVLQTKNISSISTMVSDMTNSSALATKMVKILENKHRSSDKYSAVEGFKGIDTIKTVLGTFTTVIGAIAGISLLVGGIGVMNIMLVSVTERTREIGIRKAIGAKSRDIKLQFLTESLILCLIGGTIGMLLGVGIGFLIGKLIHISAAVSPGVIITSFLFSSAVGVFFGYYPANQASKLDPIEALRYE